MQDVGLFPFSLSFILSYWVANSSKLWSRFHL